VLALQEVMSMADGFDLIETYSLFCDVHFLHEFTNVFPDVRIDHELPERNAYCRIAGSHSGEDVRSACNAHDLNCQIIEISDIGLNLISETDVSHQRGQAISLGHLAQTDGDQGLLQR
jgi:hypothetical protein